MFGLPSEKSEALVERNVDKAIKIAREGAFQSNCARCFALLGFLLGIGFPPLIGAAHLTQDSAGMPRLTFLGDVIAAEPATIFSARLPRDIGAPDPSAAAYAIASDHGDAIGVLATSYLSQTSLIDLETFKAQTKHASSMISRQPHNRSFCDPRIDLSMSLGHLASEVVQNMTWGELPGPLSETRSSRSDIAFVEVVLADLENSKASDIARAAALLGDIDTARLPEIARRNANVEKLLVVAAEKGDQRSALRVAVDFLQSNETEKAKPFLESVSTDESEEALSAMAQYYLVRFVHGNESSPEEARKHAWPHLVRAADLGREDAQLLVAHAHVSSNEFAETPDARNSSEAARRYRQLVGPKHKGNLSEVQTFAAYNLGVLSLESSETDGKNDSEANRSGEMQSKRSTSENNRNKCSKEAPFGFMRSIILYRLFCCLHFSQNLEP